MESHQQSSNPLVSVFSRYDNYEQPPPPSLITSTRVLPLRKDSVASESVTPDKDELLLDSPRTFFGSLLSFLCVMGIFSSLGFAAFDVITSHIVKQRQLRKTVAVATVASPAPVRGVSALPAAIQQKKTEHVTWLPARVDTMIRRRPELIHASIACDVAHLRSLLNRNTNVHITDAGGDTALTWSVKVGCLPAIDMLLAHGAKASHVSDNGFDTRQWARHYKNVEALSHLNALSS